MQICRAIYMDFKGESRWEDKGMGVHVLFGASGTHEVIITEEGMEALDCINVPVIFFDPFTYVVQWANATFQTSFQKDNNFPLWLLGCQRAMADDDPSPLRIMLMAMQKARKDGSYVDIFVPKVVALPFVKKDLPHSWTLHCHAVTIEKDGSTLQLMTIQAPSMVSPPNDPIAGTETATDRVIRVIDRAIANAASDDPALEDLRQRVLDGRMDEPICSEKCLMERGFSWDTSASLAMMLGFHLGTDEINRKSVDHTDGTGAAD